MVHLSLSTIDSIQSRKEVALDRFIFALGIRHVGEETAIELTIHFGNIEKFKKVKPEDLLKIQDIGEVMAKSIYNWFNNKRNLKLLEKLDKVGVKIENVKRKTQSAKFKNKIFVLTGELENMTRDEAKEKIRQLGGDVAGSVSKNTDFVVVGINPGLKFEQAKRLGVKTINEREFIKILK